MAVVAGALADVALSFDGADTWSHLVCGAITVLCAGSLVAETCGVGDERHHHRRHFGPSLPPLARQMSTARLSDGCEEWAGSIRGHRGIRTA
ncbi:hypothetical protein [Streptomyces sp. NPDC048481]|uniref:hypothetical protein n=1 Tax=Streptomyces sp. NPDC048481 TaxID=3365557 RepID=UPI003715B334